MDDESLVRLFERTEVPPDGFHHRDHVRVAWWYLRQHPLPDALARFGANLRRFALAQGKPDLFHETITTAYLLLINERLDAEHRGLAWEEFAARNGDLMTWKPSILARYYREETLASPKAKRTFVMPDRLQTADAINERAKSGKD
jgi:hypothetical protein